MSAPEQPPQNAALPAAKPQVIEVKPKDHHALTKEFAGHTLWNLVIVLLVAGAAAALDRFAAWCEHLKLSHWLCLGIDFVARVAFALDAVVLIWVLFWTAVPLMAAAYFRAIDEIKRISRRG